MTSALSVARLTRWAAVITACLAIAMTPPAAQAATKEQDAAEAYVLGKQAAQFFSRGKAQIAAELFRQAYALDPDPGYLYSAARAEQQCGKLEGAIEAYEQVIRTADASSPFPVKAKAHLARARLDLDKIKRAAAAATAREKLERKLATAQPAATTSPQTTVTTSPKPAPKASPKPPPTVAAVDASAAGKSEPVAGTWKRSVGLPAMVVGVVGVGASAVGAAMAMTEKDALDEQYLTPSGKWDASKIDEKTLNAKLTKINNRITTAWVLGGGGAVCLAAAAWMLTTAPNSATVAVLPAGDLRGLRVAVRF